MTSHFNNEQAAKYLGITPQSLRQYRYKNKPALQYCKNKKTNRISYTKEDLDEFQGMKYIKKEVKNSDLVSMQDILEEVNISYQKIRCFILKNKYEYFKIRNRIFFTREISNNIIEKLIKRNK